MSRANRAKEDAERIKQNAKYEPITILIWGPGKPGRRAPLERRKAYKKRLQIKDVLKKEFPRASVHFSEDAEMVEIGEGVIGQLRVEALQAKVSDIVLMLDISRGTDLELDHFVPRYPWFREKVHVFLPQKYVGTQGLVAEILKYVPHDQIEGFSDEEFDRCDVATVKAVRAALSAALAFYMSK